MSNEDRIELAKLGKELGRKLLDGLSSIVTPETVLRWNRELVAKKFDGSKAKKEKNEKNPMNF